MARFRPIHGLALVLVLVPALFVAGGGLGLTDYERVAPDPQGEVRLDVDDLRPGTVRFYRFLNRSNQEVKFFVGRDRAGELQVAFDASESHAAVGRGFRNEGDWMIDNKCDSPVRLAEVNAGGGGCRPVPLAHRVEGDQVVIAENAILRGWRLFN